MTDFVWHSVGVVDNENMMVPHVLQQRAEYVQQKDAYERVDDHRLVAVTELEGVED